MWVPGLPACRGSGRAARGFAQLRSCRYRFTHLTRMPARCSVFSNQHLGHLLHPVQCTWCARWEGQDVVGREGAHAGAAMQCKLPQSGGRAEPPLPEAAARCGHEQWRGRRLPLGPGHSGRPHKHEGARNSGTGCVPRCACSGSRTPSRTPPPARGWSCRSLAAWRSTACAPPLFPPAAAPCAGRRKAG